MTLYLDINADIGECIESDTFNPDAQIVPYLTSASIACGYHAGNPFTIDKTVELALQHGVGIGAHPSLPDTAGFGRRAFAVTPEEVYRYVKDQIDTLQMIAEIQGATIQHVKPHGALYNMAATDYGIARAIADAIVDSDPDIVFLALANSQMVKAGEDAGLLVAHEAFIDRAYHSDGTLVHRGVAGAVITDIDICVARALDIVRNKRMMSITGDVISMSPHSLCIHGDTAGVEVIAKHVIEALSAEGVVFASLREVIASRLNKVVRFRPMGDGALIAEFGDEISPKVNEAVLGFESALATLEIPGVVETNPSYCALTIQYDPLLTAFDKLVENLAEAEKKEHITHADPQVFDIPVCYGGEYGPDIEYVAQSSGLSISELIDIHSSCAYPLYMLGFMPGFAYLGGLDGRLHTPRLDSPRLSVPAGSIGIAGAQTGIYALESPGGWQIIGRTPQKLVDFDAEKPVIYKPGDRIRFIPISEEEFRELSDVD